MCHRNMKHTPVSYVGKKKYLDQSCRVSDPVGNPAGLEEGRGEGPAGVEGISGQYLMEISKQFYLVLFIWMTLVQACQAFNLDVDRTVLFRGQKASFFGFSLVFHRNKDGVR